MILKNVFKFQLGFILSILLIVVAYTSCVGSVKETNPKPTKSASAQTEPISFSGLINAEAVSDSKVLLSWLPAPGTQSNLTYLVYINGSTIPIEVSGASLNPDYSGAFNFTVGGLIVNTTYSFAVGVLDNTTGVKTENDKAIFATTFSNFTANFSGISSVYPAAGEAGKTEVVVEWVPATTLGSQFSPRSTDPIAYEIRYIKASDGGPQELKNRANPNVVSLQMPITLTSNTQLSIERKRNVAGLVSGTKYFFLVRAIHKSYVAFGNQIGYKLEENLQVLDVETVDNAGILDWDSDSVRVKSVPGEAGLTQVDVKWDNAIGLFNKYRVYNVKVADPNQTLVDAENNAPLFDSAWYDTQNGLLNGYTNVAAEDSFLRLSGLESFAYYKTSVVVCATDVCDQVNRIPGTARIYRVIPDRAPFSGLLSVNNPTSLSEINQGLESLDTVTLGFDPPVVSAGIVNKMELYCYSSLSDSTPLLLETGVASGTGKPGCENITRITATPLSLSGIGDFTSIRVRADFIEGSSIVSSRPYCFSLVPVIEDLTSGYSVRDMPNAVVKCKVFEITVPKNNEFLGARKVCNTSGETISVSWELPLSGIFSNFEIFYKISDGQGFKYSDAIDLSNTNYGRIDGLSAVTTSGDITGLLPGQIYTYGVLSYIVDGGGGKTYSEFNSGIQSCQVPFPAPLFKEWVDIFAVGPKVDGRVPVVLDIGETEGRKTTLFETFNRFGQPIEVEIDEDSAPTLGHTDQFGNISSSFTFDGIYGKPNADIEATELHQYSNSGIVRIAFKDITFENNDSMWDLITSKGDDTVSKKNRKYGYRIYRSADNGLTFQDLTSKDNPFQTTNNSGLLHPVDFSEKPRINETAVTFKAVNFIDYSVKALPENQSRERARVYLYKVVPVVNGTELFFPDDGGNPKNIMKVILPPANMALVNRYIANRQMCMELGKSYYRDGEADFENYYACEWNGLGSVGKSKPYTINNTVYDFGSDMLIDRYELGCNMTRGHQGNADSYFTGLSREFQGIAASGQPFKGCLQTGAASRQQSDQRDPADRGFPWDPAYKTWMTGDCVTQSETELNTGTTICTDPTRRSREGSYLPGVSSISWNDGVDPEDCTEEKWLFDNYFDPYNTLGTPESDTWLARVAQSEFLAVMHHSQATAYESYYSKEYRGAAVGGFDKPITVQGLADRVSRCSINIPVVDIDEGGHHVPRWFSVNDLNNLRHDGVDFNILESTVGEVIDTASSVGSKLYTLGGGGKAALPPSTFTESYNGRYINETPIAKVFSSNNAKLPPLASINIDDANTICRQYQVDVGAMGEGEGDSFIITEGRYRKRIMRRPEGIIANKHPESFTESYANTIDNGTASSVVPDLLEQPVTAGVPFNPSCNSFNRNVDGTVSSDGGGQSILTRFPTNRNSSGSDRVEFITGSSFYDPEGENYSSQHCVSRYGVQDLIGNFVEFSSEKIFCDFTGETLWWGIDENTDYSVNEEDANLLGQLFDRNAFDPWVLSGTDTGRCSMVEDGSDRNYNPATGGTMIPLFNGVGQLNTDIVSTLVYNDPGFRLMYRNGDGYFLDFGQGSLAAPLSVNDTISLRFTSYIDNRRKEAPGDPRESSYFNPIIGFPLSCSDQSCNQSSDNKSITTSDFFTLRGGENSLNFSNTSIRDFPIGNSNISSTGMTEITRSKKYTLPYEIEGDVTFVESIHPAGDSGESNAYKTVQTRPYSDSGVYGLDIVYWDLSRSNAGTSIYNFGGSNREIGTGRYSLEFVDTNFSLQERPSSRLGFRCVLRINEETY